MLVDARERFADRTARWILGSGLNRVEIATRLNIWASSDPDYIQMINDAARRIKNEGPKRR